MSLAKRETQNKNVFFLSPQCCCAGFKRTKIIIKTTTKKQKNFELIKYQLTITMPKPRRMKTFGLVQNV